MKAINLVLFAVAASTFVVGTLILCMNLDANIIFGTRLYMVKNWQLLLVCASLHLFYKLQLLQILLEILSALLPSLNVKKDQ